MICGVSKQKLSQDLFFCDNFSIYQEMDFKNSLKYERARTDRDGVSFSLILFKAHDNTNDLNKLIQAIYDNKRLIDTVGWFNEGNIGVILPVLNFESAFNFYVKILTHPSVNDPQLIYTIYTYPKNWINNEKINIQTNFDNSFSMQGVGLNHLNIIDRFNYQFNIEDEIVTAFVNKIPFWKRAFDIAVSLTALLFLSPLLFFVAVYIKIFSPGPVIFKQKRVGYKRNIFNFYKFRTMHVDEKKNAQMHQSYVASMIGSDTPMTKLDEKHDSRVIKGGNILRKTCIDELPQLFNVLLGDMSLVGPRPCMPYEEKEYLQWHKNRFDMLPGMTGLWQVSGKNKLSFNQMIRLDISYIKKLSIFLDIKILFLTVPTVFGLIFERAVKKLKMPGKMAENLAK